MKSRIILLLISLGIIVSANGCGLMGKKYLKSNSEQHQISTAGKKKMKLENISGNIVIYRSSDSGSMILKATKEIKVKKKYLGTPFDEIELKIDTTGDLISINSEVSKDRDDGFFKFNTGRNLKVDYEITVPSGIEIEIENINGDVTAKNLNSDLRIDLVNGDIELSNYTGSLDCEITNGSFSGEIDSTRGIDISTINGSVTLNLNNFMNANVKAETVNGRITEENLQFRVIDKEKKMFKGVLGTEDSNVDIKIETVNGKIKLIGRNEI
jgi:DUF4097 and DUF4098 domain-containing protein YvlB